MKIMSRHFRAIAMKTVEEQYWTDRKQDTRLPIHRLMQKRLKLTESIVGLLTMIAGGGIIYYLVCKRWSDVFLMSLIFAAIMALLLAVITVQDWCDMLIEKIGAL
ncbi:hypothetical protein [Roseburia hominis]|jgi:hypothetical protein|uniref:hypothetical protein n=1 Tax=Roseburia hominis TaxID=301301 RepID=UPI0005C5A66E|nr:hypothetical protein [Roseburia hominis]